QLLFGCFPSLFHRVLRRRCLLRRKPVAEISDRALVDLWLGLRRDCRSSHDTNRLAALRAPGAGSLQTSRPASWHLGSHDHRRPPDFLWRSNIFEDRKFTAMKPLIFSLILLAITASAEPAKNIRVIDIKSADGTVVKGTYFAAAKPGPGVLLFSQSNRKRDSWEDIAKQLAAAGINTLTVDLQRYKDEKGWWAAEDAAFEFLVFQPGVNRDIVGIGGVGALGLDLAVETARRHANQVKSLVLMSGETLRPQLQFLHEASQLPGLFVFSDDDEYPPEQE